MRQPSSIGSNCFSFGRSFVAWCLNHHEVWTKPAWVGSIRPNAAWSVEQGNGCMIAAAGRASSENTGMRGGCMGRAGEINPHQALPLHARIGAATDLGEVDLLALAQRWNLDAAAAQVEAPTMVAAGDGVAVEAAVMQRDAAVGTDVVQRKDASIAAAPDEHGLAEQRLVHHPPGA